MRSRGITVAALVVAALALAGGCSDPNGGTGAELLVSDEPRVVVAAADVGEATAAVAAMTHLGARLLAEQPGENAVLSPASIMFGLAMLREGAAGETAAEMDGVLGFPAERRSEAMNALLTSLETYDGDPAGVDEAELPGRPLLHVADQVFVQEGFEVQPAYLDVLAAHYGAHGEQVDFTNPGRGGGRDVVDTWVRQHTGGRIAAAPVELDRTTLLALLNTVYLAAAWDDEFARGTFPGNFFRSDSSFVRTDLMSDTRSLPLAVVDGARAVRVPFTEGFAMDVALADGGLFDAARWAELDAPLAQAKPEPVTVTLPVWEHASRVDLRQVLLGWGMTSTFGPNPDLTGIAPGLYVSQAVHQASLRVDPTGTVGAAVTAVAVGESAEADPPETVEFRADRPFSYRVVDLATGVPVFMGQVLDPTA